MSSYHSSFKYLNKKSDEDFGWIITHFEADDGETDSYLSQEQVYSDTYRGTRRILYGTKWDSVALVKITVVKQDYSDFSELECRKAYRWLTGNPQSTCLDLYIGDEIKYSFFCTVQDVKPQKMDARTVGLNIYFESISPWAYSSIQRFDCSFGQEVAVSNGVLVGDTNTAEFNIDENGVIYNNKILSISDDGTLYIDNSVVFDIDNETDDLYTYVGLNTIFKNNNSDYLSIKNTTTGEETIITGMKTNEIIALTDEQFIISDVPNKIFGNSFNFVWPRLIPGINTIAISGSGSGQLEFTYRYPIKIGDCAIDINEAIENACNKG
jgi:hypothetical protein